MSATLDPERRLAAWLEQEGPADVSPAVVEAALASARGVRQRRAWLTGTWWERLPVAGSPAERSPGDRAAEERMPAFLPARPRLGLVWVLLLAGLLLALVVGSLATGARRPDRAVVVAPSLGPVAACPPGSTPDVPGDAGQARPLSDSLMMAFDRDSARIVALAGRPDGENGYWDTWAYDVCTNRWQRMAPSQELPEAISGLAYDPDSDVVIAIRLDGTPWIYDLDANTWSTGRPSPAGGATRLAYDFSSHLVFVQEISSGDESAPPQKLWSYDVESDTWASVRQWGDVPPGASGDHLLLAYDASVDRIVASGADPNQSWTRLLDPRTGVWTSTAAPPPFNTGYFGCPGAIAYDEARQRTVVFTDGLVAAYGAAADRWETLAGGQTSPDGYGYGPQHRLGHWMVYDPVNERLVVAGGTYRTADGWVGRDDVWAFDPATREWTQLLAPSRPEPQ